MERWNWAVLGLMGIVTALGITTSSGAGKSQANLADSDVEVVACAPLTSSFQTIDAAPIELASSVPASSHAGCSACQAKKDAANGTAKPAEGSKAVDEALAWIQKHTGATAPTAKTADEPCPANCQAGGVCCDKSLPKSNGIVSITRSADVWEFTVPAGNEGVRKLTTAPLILDLDKQVCEGACPISKATSANAAADCPLTTAGTGLQTLIKLFGCENGECLAGKDHGKLTITAVEPAAQPEGLLNLVAAAEVVAANKAEASKTDGTSASTITITSSDLAKSGTGTLTLNIQPAAVKPVEITVADEKQLDVRAALSKVLDPKPAIDNSRAAARAAKLAKIEAKLETPWKWEFESVTIDELAEIVRVNVDVPVIIDRKALEEAAYDTATPIKVTKQPEIEAGEYLRGLLAEQRLTWIIPASNDRVLITTLTAMENTGVNRVFDISDLVDSASFGPEVLVERVHALVQPTTWRANGGQGDLGVWTTDQSTSLLTTNTYWAQREVADLLADLRLNNAKKTKAAVLAPEKDSGASLRRHALPSVGAIEDPELKRKLLVAQKRVLLSLLKSERGFDPAVFEIVDYNNDPHLLTKQPAEVHRRIEQTIRAMNPNPNQIGTFGASCDYGDFDPGATGAAKSGGSF